MHHAPLRASPQAWPSSYFVVAVIVVFIFGFPGTLSLFGFLVGMLLCILSSKRLHPIGKVLWSLSFLPFHVVAASIYYFAIYRREAPEMQFEHA